MHNHIDALPDRPYRLLYLDGMTRTAKAMTAGSDHKSRCLLLFYAVKYFEAVKVEGITPEEVEQLQGFRKLLSDVLIGTIKQADLIRVYPPSLQAIERAAGHKQICSRN